MDLDAFCRKLEEALMMPPNSLQPDMAFVEIEFFDSMSAIRMAALVEEMYGVLIPAEAAPNLKRIRDLDPLVRSLQAAS